MGAHAAARLRHPQRDLGVHEHAQDVRALPAAAVCDLHAGHASHVPLHGRDDRQDAHPRHHQGSWAGGPVRDCLKNNFIFFICNFYRDLVSIINMYQ